MLWVGREKRVGNNAGIKFTDASFACSRAIMAMIRPCLMTSMRQSRPRSSFVISRFSRPISQPNLLFRRSFAEDAKKPTGKPEAKPAPPKAAPPQQPDESMPKSPTKEGYDLYKIAPDTPPDPKNPFHNQHGGYISQNINEIPVHVKNVAEAITRMNLLEVAMMNKLLDEKIGAPDDLFKSFLGSMGVAAGAAAPAAAAAGAATAPGSPPRMLLLVLLFFRFADQIPTSAAAVKKAEEKKKETFNLKLVKFDESAKIKILKEIRVLRPGMNLAEVRSLLSVLLGFLCDHLLLDQGAYRQASFHTEGQPAEGGGRQVGRQAERARCHSRTRINMQQKRVDCYYLFLFLSLLRKKKK